MALEGPIELEIARVIKVDKVRWSCDLISNQRTYTEVPIAPMYLGTQGNGMFYLPEVDTLVYVARAAGTDNDDTEAMIICGVSIAAEKEDDLSETLEEAEADVTAPETGAEGNSYDGSPDYRQGRPVINEGDLVLSAKDGNFLILRAGGVIEVGSSQICRRYYIPIQNLLRDITSIYELQAAGGSMQWTTRKGEEGWGEITESVILDPSDEAPTDITIQKTPTVLSFKIREFAQEEPIITLDMGRVIPDDDAGLHPGGEASDIVLQLNVNDRFRLWIDKNGNVMKHVAGQETVCHETAQRVIHATSHAHEVLGRFNGRYQARETTITQGGDTLIVNGGRRKEITGNVEESIAGTETRVVSGAKVEVTGPTTRQVSGLYDLRTGHRSDSIGGNYGVVVTSNYAEETTGARSIHVHNASAPPEDNGIEITTDIGQVFVHATGIPGGLGSTGVTISVGPSRSLPMCAISMDVTGAVSIATNPGIPGTGGEVKINATGVALQTKFGEISVALDGTINLGSANGIGSAPVVTGGPTGTHPVCFVTGAPIMGSSQVGAGGSKTVAWIPGIPPYISDAG